MSVVRLFKYIHECTHVYYDYKIAWIRRYPKFSAIQFYNVAYNVILLFKQIIN